MDPVKIGTAIKTLRLQEGYTQQDLADSLGVSGQAVSKWERGLSVPEATDRICDEILSLCRKD